jgi:hypothetical protein
VLRKRFFGEAGSKTLSLGRGTQSVSAGRETSMKVKLRIRKDGLLLYEGAHEIADADSFGKACAEAWWKVRQQRMQKEPSIGALMEHLDEVTLDQLNGAHITLEIV